MNVQHSYDLGSKVQFLKEKTLEVFLAMNFNHQALLNARTLRPPTIRIVKPGTFMEFRVWRVENKGAGISQVKIPAVMLDPKAVEWMEERVMREL